MNIIMAAGAGKRWDHDPSFPGMSHKKQLVLINGVPLIEDIQAKIGGGILITCDPELQSHAQRFQCPDRSGCLAESILSSIDLFDDSLRVFLGDVFYTEIAVEEIKSCQEPIAFWGDASELFAMAGTDKELLRKHCQAAVTHSKQRGGHGMMWDIYRSTSDLSWRSTERSPLYHHVMGMMDFDAPCAYKVWVREHSPALV